MCVNKYQLCITGIKEEGKSKKTLFCVKNTNSWLLTVNIANIHSNAIQNFHSLRICQM